MDAHLCEKMEWLKEHYPNIRVDLTTNGQVLDKNLELVCKYVDILKISNYGFSKQSFENVHRGNLVYEEVHKNILELLSIPLGKRPKVIMSFVVCPENKGEEAAWREYWEDKCEEIFVWKVHNWGGAYVSDTVLDHKNCKSCQRPGRDFTVRTNGDVTVCCWDFNRKMPIGNITEQSFEEIYYGEKLKYFLDMHKNHTFFEKDNICYNCDQLYDRSDALLYSSNNKFIVGSKTNADSKVD